MLQQAVAAIAGIAVTNGVAAQQSLELLSRAEGCSNRCDCCSKALRQKLDTAVSNGCGRS